MRCQIRYRIRSQTRLSVIVESPFFSIASIRGLVGNFIVEEFLSLTISYPFSGNFPRFTKNDCSFRQPQINITILASVHLFLLATAFPLWSGQEMYFCCLYLSLTIDRQVGNVTVMMMISQTPVWGKINPCVLLVDFVLGCWLYKYTLINHQY